MFCYVFSIVLIYHVLFCGLTNNYIRILVNRLNNPVFVFLITENLTDRHCARIELSRLSIDCNQFGRDEIRSILRTFLQSIITTLFQTYLLTLSKINFENYLFHTFSCTQTSKVESA